MPAARTKTELNIEAPKNNKNQVIALYLYNPTVIRIFPTHRKEFRKDFVLG